MSQYLNHEKMAYTVEEASVLLSLSRAQVYRLIDRGEIESIKVGKSRRVTSRQLDTFLLGREQESGHVPLLDLISTRARSRRPNHV